MDTNRSIRNMERVLIIVLTLLSFNLAYYQDAFALSINSGASYTNTPNVTLHLNSNSYVYQVAISNESGAATTSGPSSPIFWALSTGEGPKTVNVTYSYSQPYTCQVACGSYCCGGYTWTGSCRGYCTQYCNSTCYTNGSYSESATITVDARSINTGTTPVATAINPVTNRIYVVNQDSNTLSVIDGATNTTSTVAVGSSPQAIAVNPATNKIYVANQNSTVTVIDGATNSPATIGISGIPVAIAVNSITNKIYVANQGSNTITVIDGETGIPFTSIVSSGIPVAIGVNPSTNKIYVANQGSNSLTIIDGTNNSTTTIGISGTPIGIVVNPVTNRIYVANQGSNTVAVVDGETGTQTAMIGAAGIPASIAVNPVTNRIYVANQGSNTLTVIDGSNNSPNTISVGTIPYSVSINPVTNKIYVANFVSNNVTVIDGASNATASVSAGVNPCAIGINPVTNKVYVLNKGSGNVIVVDGAVNTTSTIPVGSSPHAAAINMATNRIYVANANSNNLTVIDGATGTPTNVGLPGIPIAIAVNPVTNRIYVANQSSHTMTTIDGTNNNPTTIGISGIPVAIAINPVTNRIYVANQGSNTVSVIDGVTGSQTASIGASGIPVAIGVNPATNRIYVVNQGSNTVTVINGTNNTTATVSVGTDPYGIAINPVTNKIYIANQSSNNITVIDGATNSTTAITVGTSPRYVAIDPITNRIYVANYTSNNITIIEGATSTTSTVTVGANPLSIAVNPVMNKIYVVNTGIGNITIIDGITKATSTATTGITPAGIAVNSVTGQIYIANNGSNNVTVISEQQVQTNPLTTAITPLVGNTTNNSTPSFTLTPTNGFTPNSTGALAIYYQLDTWQGPWLTTQPTPALTPGIHTLYAFAADAQIATATNIGPQSSPLIGTMTAYQFLVVPNSPPVITEGATTSASMSKDSNPTVFSLTLHASDSDGDTLNWSISGAATNGTATASGTGVSKSISYIPNVGYVGTDTFVVQVDDGNGGVANITVNVTLNQTYPVNFASDGNGTLTGTTTQTIDSGASTSQVTAVPAINYHFVNWTGSNGFVTTTTNPLIVSNVTADQTITANFAIDTYNVTASPGVNGSLDATTPSPATINHGATTSFKFNADSGHYVSSVSGCSGSTYTNSDQSISSYTYNSGAITGSCAVSATFTQKNTTGPTFSSASYFGGTGDEHGTGIAITNGVLFTVGYGSKGGILARYALPPDSTPSWSTAWPNQDGNDNFLGVAVTSSNVYTVGSNYNRTSDGGGDKEPKGLVAQFLLTGATGTGYGGSVWDVQTPAAPGAFSYSGYEGLNAILNTVEASNDFIYTTGLAQINGNSGRLFLSKLNAAGTILWTVNDSVEMLWSGYNRGLGLAALNNYIYVAGASHDSGTDQPYLRKYDQSGALVWTRKSTLSGSYQGVTAFGGAIYAVGQTGAPDFLIEKWDESGNVLWTRQYDRNAAEDILNGVTVLGSNIYAAGSTKGSTAGGSDAALLQIDPATGNLLSTTLWGGAQDDAATGIATDGQDLYLIGNTASFGAGGIDMVLLRYTVQTVTASKVLVAGGWLNNSTAPPTAEVFDQAAGTWSSTSNTIAYGTIPTNGICGANMTLLGSGKALVAGGSCGGDNGTTTNATSIYDPATNLWSTGAPMAYGRNNFGLVTLASGDALAFAGCSGGCSGPNVLGQYFGTVGGTAQRYSTTDNSWTTKQSLNTRRAGLGNQNNKTVTLQNGKVLVCGGNDAFSTTYTSCEIYDPTANTWTPTAGSYPELYGPTGLVLLNNGKVLSAYNYSPGAALFDPVARTWSATGAPLSVQNSAQLVKLSDGRVLMTGGYVNNAGTNTTLTTAQIYDPTSGTWAATGSMGIARFSHFTVLLEDGKVLAGGGVTGSTAASWGPPVASAEIFDPATGVWNATGAMTQARWNSINAVRLLPPVVNNLPVITEGTDIAAQMSKDGAPTAFSLTLHSTDIDGDTPTWSIVNAAAHGTATANGTGASKAISYTPTPGYVGPDSFAVQVNDGKGGTDSITVNVTVIQAYTLNFAGDGNGTLTGTTSQTINIGAATTEINAVPNTGYHFVNWTGSGGFVTTTANPLTVSNVTAAMTITANFAIDTFTLTVSKTGAGTGTVTSSPAGVDCGATCSASFPVGEAVVLFQNPINSSGFSGWGGEFCSGTGDCAFSMSADRSVSADFTLSPMVKNQRTGVAYSLLQTAYTDAIYGDTIMALNTLPTAGLILDAAKILTIEGGYASDYASCSGLTPILGPINIKNLTRVSGLAIRTPASSTKAITAFSFSTPVANGIITENTHSIAISVPSETDVTALIPAITHTGASISPAIGVPQDFTNPVVYTVTAEDESTQTYTVTIQFVAPYILPTSAIDISLGANSVLVDGTRAYIIAGTTFKVLDVSNPLSPALLGSVAHGYSDMRVEAHAIHNNIVWCVRSSSGGYGQATYVFGVDVSNPANPVISGSLTLKTATSLLANTSLIYSGYLLVHDYSDNLIYVIDINNPDTPALFSQWGVPNMVNGGPAPMMIDGSLLYLPCRENNTFRIYNLTNLAAVVQEGSVALPGDASGPPVKLGSYVYLSDAYGLRVIDVSTPTAPAIVGSLAASTGYLKLKNDRLISFDISTPTVRAYSLSNPTVPVLEASSAVAVPAPSASLTLSPMSSQAAIWVGDYLIGMTYGSAAQYHGARALNFPVN